MDNILDKKIGQTFWKLLEVGDAGGMPLAVTHEDCLVDVHVSCQAIHIDT